MDSIKLQRQLAAAVVALIVTLIGGAASSNTIAGLGVLGLIGMFFVIINGED